MECLVLPVTVVVPGLLLLANRYLSLPTDGWSLRHYQALLLSSRDGATACWIVSSLPLSARRLLALLLGTSCARSAAGASLAPVGAIRFLMLRRRFIVPSIVHALGFYQAWCAASSA